MREKAVYLLLAMIFLALLGHRVWRVAQFDRGLSHTMPSSAMTEAEERELYLLPAGKYTRADIAANGRTTAAARYRGFRANHDFAPAPDDAICPITRTKANRECTWIIGGQTYEFCCPPCIDEFVQLAKEQPEQVLTPEEYVQQMPQPPRGR